MTEEATQDAGAGVAAPEGPPEPVDPKSRAKAAMREAIASRGEPEAPEETPEEPAPAAPETEATEPTGPDEGDAEPADLPERFTDEGARVRGPDGRYYSREDVLADGVDAEPLTEEEVEASESEEGDAPAEGFVRIELEEDHPLRDRGREFIDVPEEDEDIYRSQVNNAVRNRELEQERKRRQELEERLAALEGQTEALQSEEVQKLEDPRLQRLVEDVEETYGEDVAQVVREGLQAKKQQVVSERAQDSLASVRQERAAEQFVEEATRMATKRYGVWRQSGELDQILTNVLVQYGEAVDRTGREPSLEEIRDVLDRTYMQDPRVKSRFEEVEQERETKTREQIRQEEREKLREELQEQEQEKLKDAARRRRENPAGRMGAFETGARTPRPEDEEPDFDKMTATQIARHKKKQLMGR